jgi:hypothetical protein
VFEVERLLFTMYQLNGSATVINELHAGSDWTQLRVAEDEALWLGPLDSALDPALRSSVVELGPDASLCDVSDGWAGIALQGATRLEILASISPLRVRVQSGEDRIDVAQGNVLGLPAKVLSSRTAVSILLPATASWYVGACLADLGFSLEDAPAAGWSTGLMVPTYVASTMGG